MEPNETYSSGTPPQALVLSNNWWNKPEISKLSAFRQMLLLALFVRAQGKERLTMKCADLPKLGVCFADTPLRALKEHLTQIASLGFISVIWDDAEVTITFRMLQDLAPTATAVWSGREQTGTLTAVANLAEARVVARNPEHDTFKLVLDQVVLQDNLLPLLREFSRLLRITITLAPCSEEQLAAAMAVANASEQRSKKRQRQKPTNVESEEQIAPVETPDTEVCIHEGVYHPPGKQISEKRIV